MKVYEVQCASWDRIHLLGFLEDNLEIGDFVVVKNEQNLDLVKVVGVADISESNDSHNDDFKTILRKATKEEIEKNLQKESTKEEDISFCREFIKKNSLNMKVVDAYYSLDGGKITFAFASEGRVDFRSLVKDLTNHFHRSIRLQQLGVRDVARAWGEIGLCGREQCCRLHLRKLANVTTDMAEIQQVSHRGADRLSGICGRLKCCMVYELSHYKSQIEKMPPIGSEVITSEGEKGKIISWNILKNSVNIRLSDKERIIKEDIDKIKIKKK